jgi:hypothetical protein
VLIGKGDKYDIKQIPVADKTANKIFTKTSFELKDNVLKGHVTVTLTGEERTGFLQYYHDVPRNRQKELIQNLLRFGNRNLFVNNVKTSDLHNREIPVTLEGDIDLTNYVIAEDKELYLGIDFFPQDLNSFIPEKDRQHDYVFHSAYVTANETELTLPAGYKIISLPDSINLQYPDYGMQAAYQVKGNKVIFKKSISFSSGRIHKKDFENWKVFVGKLKDFNSNLISIQKP